MNDFYQLNQWNEEDTLRHITLISLRVSQTMCPLPQSYPSEALAEAFSVKDLWR